MAAIVRAILRIPVHSCQTTPTCVHALLVHVAPTTHLATQASRASGLTTSADFHSHNLSGCSSTLATDCSLRKLDAAQILCAQMLVQVPEACKLRFFFDCIILTPASVASWVAAGIIAEGGTILGLNA